MQKTNPDLAISGFLAMIASPVSAETAMQMAEGVRKISGADIGISTTGIAGPTGGIEEKPVGLVFVGICTKDKSYAVKLNLGGNENMVNSRSYIRRLTSDMALFAIINEIYNMSK